MGGMIGFAYAIEGKSRKKTAIAPTLSDPFVRDRTATLLGRSDGLVAASPDSTVRKSQSVA
jgi:hypothetical protein